MNVLGWKLNSLVSLLIGQEKTDATNQEGLEGQNKNEGTELTTLIRFQSACSKALFSQPFQAVFVLQHLRKYGKDSKNIGTIQDKFQRANRYSPNSSCIVKTHMIEFSAGTLILCKKQA